MTITEFLTARYDEEALLADYALMQGEAHEHNPDRRDATVTLTWNWGLVANYSDGAHAQALVAGAPTPARVLSDIAAKRAILRLYEGSGLRITMGQVLRALAQPYAEHPDFDPAWRV